jgi:hypothetical protein
VKDPRDMGYADAYRGWYDVTGCGRNDKESRCLDYCRWVGNSGSGGNPLHKVTHGKSTWSCSLANETTHDTRNLIGHTWEFGGQTGFWYKKCDYKGQPRKAQEMVHQKYWIQFLFSYIGL